MNIITIHKDSVKDNRFWSFLCSIAEVEEESENISGKDKNLKKLEVEILNHFDLVGYTLTSSSRRAKLVTCRQIFCFIAYNVLDLDTYENIGYYLGKREHATIIHSRNKFIDLMETDKKYREVFYGFIKEYYPAKYLYSKHIINKMIEDNK